MSVTTNQNGISLVELILALTITVVVIVTLSLSFPIASKHALINRQRWVASSLADSQMQTLKSQPYAFLDTTDVTNPGIFPGTIPNCDCTQLDFSTLPSTSSTVAGTTFNLVTCVNYASPIQCATAVPSDTGTKNILVRVYWTVGGSTSSVTQSSSLSRD